MSIKNTVQAGNEIVSTKSGLVEDISSAETKNTVQDLIDTMRHTDLVGMAAPQIGLSQRIFVTEIRDTKFRKDGSDKLRVYINPEIIKFSENLEEDYEGCGSVSSATFFGPVRRSVEVIVKAQDENGKSFELIASGLLARVIQHEVDHLDGILFHEKITDMKKVMSKEEYIKRL